MAEKPKFTGIIASEHIKGIIKGISKMVYEPGISIRKDGFYIEESDAKNTVITSIFIPNSIFNEYKYEKDMEIYLKGSTFLDNLKKMQEDITIGTDGALLSMHEIARNKTYEIRLVAPLNRQDYKAQIEKAMAYKAEEKTKISIRDMKDAIKDSISIFDKSETKHCMMIFSKGGISLKSESGDGFNKFIQRLNSKGIKKEVSARFPLEDLEIAMDLMVGETAEIQLSQDHPIKIDSEMLGIRASIVIGPVV